MSKRKPGAVPDLPDKEARRKIIEELDKTFFVEAGAGSGKTKSLVDRMIALLIAGKRPSQGIRRRPRVAP